MDLDVEVPKIVIVRNRADPGDPVVGQVSMRRPTRRYEWMPHGSAMSLSVSLIILFGRAMMEGYQTETRIVKVDG